MAIRNGQTYRSNNPVPYGPAQLSVSGYQPGDAVVPATDPDTGAGCHVLADDLHATRPTGADRYDGYTLVHEN